MQEEISRKMFYLYKTTEKKKILEIIGKEIRFDMGE
jgi:hypothetical protein